MLALASYLFFLELSGRWHLAALASLSLLFMPVVQWWYSTTYVELTAYFFFLLYSFKRLVLYRSTWQMGFWMLVFAYISLCFAFLLYLPTLVPALICLVLMMTGILLDSSPAGAGAVYLKERQARIRTSARSRVLLLSLALVLFVDALALGMFTADNRGPIDSISQSTYPGRRREEGGSLRPSLVLGGFLNIALLNNNLDPKPIGNNQSEASSYFALSLFLLPVLIFMSARGISIGRPDFFLIFSLLAYLLLLIWSFFDLPDVLRRALFLDFSSPRRVPIVLGSLNHILIFYFLLAQVQIEKSHRYVSFALFYSLTIFGTYLYWMHSLKSTAPNFLSNWNTGIWVSLAILGMLFLLLLQKRLAFWLVFLGFSLASTFSVNPLYRGLSIITSSKLSDAVHDINQTDQNRSFWIVYDTELLANYLIANGVRVLNSTQFAPQNELWEEFDPTGQYVQVYNRYAHIVVKSTPELNKSEFLLGPPDALALYVNPCHPLLEELGVFYYVFPSRAEFECLRHIRTAKFKSTPIYIYQKVPSP